MQIIIKVSVAEFIFSKISCFQHIFLNTSKRIHSNYETLKMKAVRAIKVIKNKKPCFQLCLDHMCTLILSTQFLNTHFDFEYPRLGAQVRLHAQNIGHLKRNYFTRVNECFPLKLNFSHETLQCLLEQTPVKLRNSPDLRKLSTLIESELFQFLSKFCTYL